MKVLLDECVDRRVAEPHFDVFLTVDRNLSFQQPVPNFNIALLIVRARSNRLHDFLPLVPELLEALPATKRGQVTFIGSGARSGRV